MEVSELGSVTSCRSPRQSNAWASMVESEFGSVTFCRELQHMNAYDPMVVSKFGSVTLVRLVLMLLMSLSGSLLLQWPSTLGCCRWWWASSQCHLLQRIAITGAPTPMEVSEVGSVASCRELPNLNAHYPLVVSEFGRDTSFRESQ